VSGEAVGGEAAATVPWALSEGGSVWSGRGRSVVWTGRLTGVPSGFNIFLNLSKPAQTWKLKMDALLCSKKSQILGAARLGHYEQHSWVVRQANMVVRTWLEAGVAAHNWNRAWPRQGRGLGEEAVRG
jgi:hypothetical protein